MDGCAQLHHFGRVFNKTASEAFLGGVEYNDIYCESKDLDSNEIWHPCVWRLVFI